MASHKETIGRKREIRVLKEMLQSNEAELVAIYGRRRVGKTFLVQNTYREHLLFQFSGVHDAPMEEQLLNFGKALGSAMGTTLPPAAPKSWSEAFDMLVRVTEPLLAERAGVIFFDEFPWIDSPRAGFLRAFEYFWNTWGTQQPNLVFVICGSAASWMIQNVVHNRGGLHNRITQQIRLQPFTLAETEEFLLGRGVNLDRYQVAQLYMAMGGIPHYLRNVKRGESAVQAIDRICFQDDGILRGEFRKLYRSLFSEADRHISIVRALAKKPSGLTRTEIIKHTKLPTGGGTTQLIHELLESGFIAGYVPFGKRVHQTIYKLADEYSAFYLKFIEGNEFEGSGAWLRISDTPSWRSWSGMAFESLCLKHIPEIKAALGISGIYTKQSAWRHRGSGGDDGCQIDLLIDRRDHCISVCEMKFSLEEYEITKPYADAIRKKLQVFKANTKTKKTLLVTFVTTFGVVSNMYKTGVVSSEVVLGDLFRERT